MTPSLQKVVFAVLGAVALTAAASGQGNPSLEYAPSGDVWIVPDETNLFSRVGDVATSSQLPTGDVWPTTDNTIGTIQPVATRHVSPAPSGDTGASRSMFVAPK